MKTALCRISDTEPLRSIVPMLAAAGYDCVLPDRKLRDLVRDLGGRNVDEPRDMERRWGAEPLPPLPEVGPDMLETCDLYVDVNGRNGTLLTAKYPRLKGKVLCYFINGGEPRNVPDKGDCQTPEWPMVTTAQHYKSTLFCPRTHWNKEAFSCDDPPNPRGYWTNHGLSHPPQRLGMGGEVEGFNCPHEGCGPLVKAPWLGKVYTFYPAFTRWDEVQPRRPEQWSPPVSFVHNSMSWGGQAWWPWAEPLGVRSFGGGNSPSGLVQHTAVWDVLSRALCTVYLKSGGAVDYGILEPMAAGCPTTFHSSYVHNCRLYDLLEDGETCLMWDSAESMAACIEMLKDPKENRRIGLNGQKRMTEVCWNAKRAEDVSSFQEFMGRMFP